MYVITVARTEPISAISAKKRMNAIAVHTTESPRTDPITSPEGIFSGKLKAAIGR